jgi:hypothetical protein
MQNKNDNKSTAKTKGSPAKHAIIPESIGDTTIVRLLEKD